MNSEGFKLAFVLMWAVILAVNVLNGVEAFKRHQRGKCVEYVTPKSPRKCIDSTPYLPPP